MTSSNRHILIATIPAAVVGVWNLGIQILTLPMDTAGDWQLTVARAFADRFDTVSTMSAFTVGAAAALPLIGIAVLVSYFWASLFSRARARPLDSGWFVHAWLFSLLLPPTMPPGFAAIALSFGLVFGCHVFGGTGRYLVNPALLAVIFLTFAYPAQLDATATTWSIIAAAGTEAATNSGATLFDAFIGREAGAIGTPSVVAAFVGALYLVVTRTVSPLIIAAGVAALLFSGAISGALAWPWHLALGNFAFVLAFVATDPSTQPRTTTGKLVFGALFGALTVIVRTADPAHPEGSLAALMLASLVIPLIDHLTERRHREAQSKPAARDGALE